MNKSLNFGNKYFFTNFFFTNYLRFGTINCDVGFNRGARKGKLLARVHVVCATKIQMNYGDKTIPVLKLFVSTSHPNDRFSSTKGSSLAVCLQLASSLRLDFAKADIPKVKGLARSTELIDKSAWTWKADLVESQRVSDYRRHRSTCCYYFPDKTDEQIRADARTDETASSTRHFGHTIRIQETSRIDSH